MSKLARILSTPRAAIASIGLALALAASASAQTPQIRADWSGGVLNVTVTNLPPNTPVELTVTDESHGGNETPNGTVPQSSDGAGNLPGSGRGGEIGYPSTGTDEGGTRYVICVRVNGHTGPCIETTKPRGFLGSIAHAVITLGGIFGDIVWVPIIPKNADIAV
jgi:hypothetical protein